MSRMRTGVGVAALVVVIAAVCGAGGASAHTPEKYGTTALWQGFPAWSQTPAARAAQVRAGARRAAASGEKADFEGPVPRAECGPGSKPEVGLQGEVPLAERESGRATDGYRCNLEVLGNYPGEGASWQHTWYGTCAYYDTRGLGGEQRPGVVVVDASDPAGPSFAGNLTSQAMVDPWESLSVAPKRGLLAGVGGPYGNTSVGFFDVYDVSRDCRKPKLKASLTVNTLGHEGDWAPDGRTYYASGAYDGSITPIDVTDPAAPKPLGLIRVGVVSHGLSVSQDGNRLYAVTVIGDDGANGLNVLDVSDFQRRAPAPQAHVVSQLRWTDGCTGQHTIPVTIGGRPYVIAVDEQCHGAARIIDIADERRPRIVSKLKLEIQMPENGERAAETGSDSQFGYNAHYCSVDRQDEPTVLGCSHFESGVRIFDIRDPSSPREIAYLNPGGNGGVAVPGSQRGANSTSGYPSARVRFVEERGEIWFTDQDKGFFIARFTNGAWPFKATEATEATTDQAAAKPDATPATPSPSPAPPTPAAGAPSDLGLPSSRSCISRRNFVIRLRAPRGEKLRSARVLVSGRRVRVMRRGGRLRARVDLRGRPQGRVRVKIVARTRSGRTVKRTRRYRTCTPRAAR